MRKAILAAACAGVLSLGAWDVSAAVIQWRDGGSGTFNGSPVTSATFDDAHITTDGTVSANQTNNNGFSNQTRTVQGGVTDWGLIALKDMFTLLPKTSGGDTIQINSATLYLWSRGGQAIQVNAYRGLSDWLVNAAGSNENNVSGEKRSISGNQTWSSGNFSAGDFTTSGAASTTWSSTFGAQLSFDVTSIVQDMYANNVNFGFVLKSALAVPTTAQTYTTKQGSTITQRPLLAIDYEYIPEPSAALVVAGAAGLMLRRRRTV